MVKNQRLKRANNLDPDEDLQCLQIQLLLCSALYELSNVVNLSNYRTGWPPGILEHAPQSEHFHDEFVNRQSNIAHIRVHSTHTQFA